MSPTGKLNGSASALDELEAMKAVAESSGCELVVCPSFTSIERAARAAEGTGLTIGASLKAADFAPIASAAVG